ncbi:MAG: membrane protein insertase YidC, partial [Pseudomonadota bacterium]
MKNENTRNTVLAMALSLAVLVGWQFLIVKPRMEEEKARAAVTEAQQKQKGAAPSVAPAAGPGAAAPVMIKTREQALVESQRVVIDTPSLNGSINLKGGRLDDLALKNYHETVDD